MQFEFMGKYFEEKHFSTDLPRFVDHYEIREQKSWRWHQRHGYIPTRIFKGGVVYLMVLDSCLDGSELIPLYVGHTTNLLTRIQQHREKSWFNHVEYLFVEEFPSKSEAEKVERELIEKLRPVFNKQVKGRKRIKPKLHTPKTSMVKNLLALTEDETFNGDDNYKWVTEDLPTISIFPLR